jgi:hypothetical protein
MSFSRPPKIVNSVDALITKRDKNDRRGSEGCNDNTYLDEPNILCPKSCEYCGFSAWASRRRSARRRERSAGVMVRLRSKSAVALARCAATLKYGEWFGGSGASWAAGVSIGRGLGGGPVADFNSAATNAPSGMP